MKLLIRIARPTLLALLICFLPAIAFGVEHNVTKSFITLSYDENSNGSITVKYIYNGSKEKARVYVDSREYTISPNQGIQTNQNACKKVYANFTSTQGPTLWRFKATNNTAQNKAENSDELPDAPEAESLESDAPSAESPSQSTATSSPMRNKNSDIHQYQSTKNDTKNRNNSYVATLAKLDDDPFFGTAATTAFVNKTSQYAQSLSASKDKPQFIIDNDIDKYITDSEAALKEHKAKIQEVSIDYVIAAKITDNSTQSALLNQVNEALKNSIIAREEALAALKAASDDGQASHDGFSWDNLTMLYLAAVVALLVLLIIVLVVLVSRSKRNKRIQSPSQPLQPDFDPANPAIVVRRRTTSILKKQSLDDVISNPEYLLIKSSDFTPDSAVRNIYVKNTCIKDVYGMYAEDLRNSANPKEDGCMVLGRWVFDEAAGVYDVSLETVIFPGDDAEFKEFELNFGGKIKLKVAEKLRKLRRETNLQYDLVCWIHSHPGLGVFFSNSDNNVQAQLKHPKHPYFLTAFVVDILTSSQEMGIFTFRTDGVMNSKADLTKMYSLEDMYKWALESVKNSFSKDDHYNLLAKAKSHSQLCKGIELDNNSIIDLTQVLENAESDIVGWAMGAKVDVNGAKEYAVTNIVALNLKPSAGLIGIVLRVTHMSLPTIQRMVATIDCTPAFVLVYSSRQGTLTAIPVINGEIATDENYYGEETIDDLKIWTRRKR